MTMSNLLTSVENQVKNTKIAIIQYRNPITNLIVSPLFIFRYSNFCASSNCLFSSFNSYISWSFSFKSLSIADNWIRKSFALSSRQINLATDIAFSWTNWPKQRCKKGRKIQKLNQSECQSVEITKSTELEFTSQLKHRALYILSAPPYIVITPDIHIIRQYYIFMNNIISLEQCVITFNSTNWTLHRRDIDFVLVKGLHRWLIYWQSPVLPIMEWTIRSVRCNVLDQCQAKFQLSTGKDQTL